MLSGVLMAAALLALLPGLAAAHAKLASSDPADGAQIALTDAPKTVNLTFTEEVSKSSTTVKVTAADGTVVTSGPTTVDFDNPKLVSVPLNTLAGGTYTVAWHAVTEDDNGQSDGTFQFTIVVNTGGGTATGGTTTTTGGTTTTTTGGTTTLPSSGTPWQPSLLALIAAGAGLLLALGLGLRRLRAGQPL
jgi:methionine-rich copper-binding protein CopC